ncbi:MAG TPA: hypothetical protein VFO01_06360 [Trebonia sp.]|nr:hypothetical protein [Trebonia sp.]
MTGRHERGGSGGPPPVSNPPGLPQIAYRTGDFATFRRALLTPLPGEQQLSAWSPRPGDLGLQALEWWAYLADILTFYNERIANGSYLGTAAAQPGPQNAAGLAKLLGYLATPAITATGVVAAIRGASAPDGPFVIPAGLQIASTPTAEAPVQLFEVTEGRTFTGPSDAVIGLPADPALLQPGHAPLEPAADGATQQAVLLTGQVSVSPGDQLVLVKRGWDGTTADWAVVTAQSATAEKAPDGQVNTRLTLSSADWHGLAAGPPLAADYQLRRAPATARLWTMAAGAGGQPAAGAGNPPAGPAPRTLTVPLATLARNLVPGDNVLFTGSAGGTSPRAFQLLAQVTAYTEEVTRVPAAAAGAAAATRAGAPPAVYISHALLTVRATGADGDVAALRSVLGTPAAGGIAAHYGFRDVGTPMPAPATALKQLPVTVTVPPGLRLPGGPVALQDANGAGLLVTAAAGTPGTVTLTPADGGPGVLSPALRAPVRLLAGLVPVSRGTTVAAETLGDGNPAVVGQAFALRHSPLVYLPPAEPGGDPVSALRVSVNRVPWREVRTFSGQPHDATVYAVSQLPDGSVQVQFGDGVNGARLPLGTGNVTATYRYGAPAPPPPAGSLATVLQPQPDLATVRNPVAITPGTAQETAAETAAAAPATVVLLPGAASASPPLISLDDSERLAATVSGVTRVRAYWTWDQELHCPAVTVYVGSETGTAAAVTAAGGLFPRGTSRVPLRAAPARGIGLAVGCRLAGVAGAGEDAVRAAATRALTGPGGLFSPGRLGIGQRLYRSQVEGALTAGGLAAVLSLSVHRHGEDDAPGEPALDPGQDGYFTLPAADLSISVVTR